MLEADQRRAAQGEEGFQRMSTHRVSCALSGDYKKVSLRGGWQNGDYLEAIDNIIPILCQDLDCYAEVCGVERSVLLKDVLAAILLEAPGSSHADDDYRQCISAIREWLLQDVDAVARSFDLQFSEVLIDVLKVIISDTTLADDFVKELAMRVALEVEAGSPGPPC